MGKSEGIISSRTKYVEVFSRTVILIEVYPMCSDDCTIPMVSFLRFSFFIYPPLFFTSPSFPSSPLFLIYIHDPFSCFLYLVSVPPSFLSTPTPQSKLNRRWTIRRLSRERDNFVEIVERCMPDRE